MKVDIKRRDTISKKIRYEQAVSDVVGVILLLAITVMLFTMLNSHVFTFSLASTTPSVNLIGTIDKKNNMIYIEHNGGDSLEITTDIIITIGSNTITKNAADLLTDINHNFKWNVGETLKYNFEGINITGKYIGVMVVDSNALLLSVVLQKGLS